MIKKNKYNIETQIVHGNLSHTSACNDLVDPIHMTSTFSFKNSKEGEEAFSDIGKSYVYTRISNPTTKQLNSKIALLEEGDTAVSTASGMSAIASIIMTFANPGDNFVTCNSVYGGTFALFNNNLKKFKIIPRFISPQNAGLPEKIEKLINNNTKLLFLETPSNPTLDAIDIKVWAKIAKKHKILLVVDNTFATPYLQKPLTLGADVVVHSATKYLCGHGDIIAGVIVSSKKIIDKINTEYLIHFGPCISPFNSWLILRGIKTLALRMEKHSDNALKIALWLSKHKDVKKVYYPGLKTHPSYEIAKKQMKKYSGVLSFEVYGGMDAGKKVLDNIKLCVLAVSLGDCETLIQHPPSMTHSSYLKEDRVSAGISDGLIRLSVGIENPDDIIDDLKEALSLLNS